MGNNSSNYDPTIGRLQIWQDPACVKGSWQQAAVISWDVKANGYRVVVFDQGRDYVQDRPSTVTETQHFLAQRPGNMVRYSEADVKQYGHHYGLHQRL